VQHRCILLRSSLRDKTQREQAAFAAHAFAAAPGFRIVEFARNGVLHIQTGGCREVRAALEESPGTKVLELEKTNTGCSAPSSAVT